jgi:drug/metabolite transporter (DMT)-like permease
MIKGIVYILTASVSLAVMGALIKEIGIGLPTFMVVFSRFFISLIVMIPVVIKDNNFSLKVNKPQLILFRCIAGLTGMTLWFYALKYVPLPNVLLLQNTRPVFVPIILLVFLGVKTRKSVVMGIIISFAGIAVIINPTSNVFQPAAVFALLAGLCAAVAIILLRRFILANQYRTKEALFYFFLFSTVVTGTVLPFVWITPSERQIGLLILTGLFGTAYQFFMTASLKYLSVRIVTPMLYLSVIFGGIISYLVWNRSMPSGFIIGMIITLAGVVTVVFFSAKDNKNQLKK